MWTSLRIYIYKIVDFINGLSGLLYRTGWTSVNGILILKNTDAAEKLVNDIEDAIQERLEYPLAFEPFPSKKRDYPYYRIYIYTKLCNILCCYRGCNGSQKISLWSKRYKSLFIK